MNALAAAYGSDDDAPTTTTTTTPAAVVVTAAPEVDTLAEAGTEGVFIDPALSQVAVNVRYDDLVRPVIGPANPFTRTGHTKRHSDASMALGLAENYAMRSHDFDQQRRLFDSRGVALNPTNSAATRPFVGNMHNLLLSSDNDTTQVKLRRLPRGDPAKVEGYAGPWAGYEDQDLVQGIVVEPTEEEVQEELAREEKEKLASKAPSIPGNESSVFHGHEERDYQGRTYISIPRDLGIDLTRDTTEHECFLPKKHAHTWTGHTRGVNAIRFFPGSGHLLLSCSMDHKVKLWDVYHDRRCLRTFIGHDKAVRDVYFTNDGRHFLSASYDQYIKLWDTETGQCVSRFTNGHIPYCVRFHPDEDKQHTFLAGCSDNKIIQWDTRTGDITQEYNQHLGSVNTVTFIDDNRRIVSTSDDKTLRVWDFDIPVVTRYIAEAHMQSMPSVALHPNQKWFAAQSLDNQILIYSARDRVKLHRKKRFVGHGSSGYAVQVNFSPDGKYLVSGDSGGHVMIWNWKDTKVAKKIKAHSQVTIGVEWHPQEPSKLATCSWDNTIKLWE